MYLWSLWAAKQRSNGVVACAVGNKTYYLGECRSEMMIISSFKEVRYNICT